VPAELAVESQAFEVELLGELRPAVLAMQPLYDPAGKKVRS